MVLRIRSRDGLERVKLENPAAATVSDLKSAIQSQLQIPIQTQNLSTDKNLLLAKTPSDLSRFADISNPAQPLSSLGLSHGSLIFLAHSAERSVPGGPAVTPAGSFGRKMTMDDLIARQTRVSRQDTPNCASVSLDRFAADAFQRHVNEALAFAVKRAGFMYGSVSSDGEVSVEFVYEPPQRGGSEDEILLLRDADEERLVDAIADGLGLRRVGLVFSQTVAQAKTDYTLSNREVLLATELHAESGLKEWVTAIVKLEVSGDGDGASADVHFEAFQMSDTCVRLFSDGWFETEISGEIDPKLSRLKKEVVVGVKDTKEIDNDFFLVVVKILDHQGPLSSTFPIENRDSPVTMRALKTHLDRTKNLPFVKRISDFHLLLFLSKYLDINTDVPALTMCVRTQTDLPEGYKILIESMASA